MFGGDEDFGFNPGDEEMMEFMGDDSDSDFDDIEDVDDNVQQIFTSLGDSHVIRRLSYHKHCGDGYQLPRLTLDRQEQQYSYEEVYR